VTTDPTIRTERLSSGKEVVLTRYGWYQPAGQHRLHGNFTAKEAAEAWKLWDEERETAKLPH
jgi:hypothetical protein